jgi:hypothetical protein
MSRIGPEINTFAFTVIQPLGGAESAGAHTASPLAHGAKSARVVASAAMDRVTFDINTVRLTAIRQANGRTVQRFFQVTAAPSTELA